MTKQGILDHFKDINEAYNDCTRFDSLSRMIDELLESKQAEIERLQPKTVNPVKPLDVDDDYTYLCDSCKGELFCGDVLRDHFCPSCGGRIEWKDGDGDGT